MTTVAERLAIARAGLEAAGIPPADAALDAEVLARHALGWDRAKLLADAREPAPAGFEHTFDALLARRIAREPVAQIVGIREFWDRDFEVNRDVLVPRPETEIIVEEALAFARRRHCDDVIDVGTGSGCLAVTIACELPTVRVTATDTSEAALNVARRNAARHGITDRIRFVRTNVLDGISGKADLIVSNPPYVPDSDAAHLQPEVVRFEPHAALFGGPTGMEVIRRLLVDAGDRLANEGMLVVEFGFGQCNAVKELAQETGWNVRTVREDLQGIPRTIVLSKSG
jgi:release factor glutamine methyltransferase